MSVSHVQRNQTQTASGTSHACAFGSNVTSGNLLVATFSSTTNTSISSVSDTRGNTWERVIQPGTVLREQWCTVSGSSGANTVTGTSATTAVCEVAVYEASSTTGWPTAGSRVDTSGSNATVTVTSHPCASTGLNTSVADVYGVTSSVISTGAFAPTQATNWNGAATTRGYHQYRVLSSTISSETAAWSSAATESAASTMVMYEAAASSFSPGWAVNSTVTIQPQL